MFDVTFEDHVDFGLSLRHFSRNGDDGLDRWDGLRFTRTARTESGATVAYAARVSGADQPSRLMVVSTAETPAIEEQLAAHIHFTVVTDFAALHDLAQRDASIAMLAGRYPGLAQVLVPDPVAALIRSISAQQVNLRWAATIRRRLAERYGVRHAVEDTWVFSLDPTALATATIDELRALQLTHAKARAVIAVGEAAQAGELDPKQLNALSDDELIAHLVRLRGIGVWSAEWFLARTLGRPRVVAGDLGVRKAVALLYRLEAMPTERDVRLLTEDWGAAATMAQAVALHHLAVESGVA